MAGFMHRWMFNNLVTMLLILLSTIPGYGLATSTQKRVRGHTAAVADGPPVDVYYVTRMADKFAAYTAKHKKAMETLHEKEQQRLEEAIEHAPTEKDKSLLETTASVNEMSRLEAVNALDQMETFVNTLKQAMGARGSVMSCHQLTCGTHGYCTQSMLNGATCVCKDGYEGDGFLCGPRRTQAPHVLLTRSAGAAPGQVADAHVIALPGNKLAVVYRDISDRQRGYMMLGHSSPEGTEWSAPMLFSGESQAYAPMLVALPSGSFAIVFRDQNRGGTGMLLSGTLPPANSSKAVSFSSVRIFAKHLAQATALLPMAGSQFVVFYSEHVLKDSRATGMYGAAVLAEAKANNDVPELLGKHRFALGAVTRLTAMPLSPSSFILAYRGGEQENGRSSEASCIFGQLKSSELVFSPHRLEVDPDHTQIWARSLQLVQSDTFTYTYFSGGEQATKQAIVKVDPVSHRLRVVHGPQVIAQGFTSFLNGVSTFPGAPSKADQPQGPHNIATFMQGGADVPGHAHVCTVEPSTSLPSNCEAMTWSNFTVTSMSSTAINDGRVVMVFTDVQGTPYYQLLGMQRDF
mmetsp:Transcript_23978/g.55351  ORF Transcript_23978/g.55351 Transcript_23978/m.55351 type:complete len:575 (+) Transcript_23978:61-1785(+)